MRDRLYAVQSAGVLLFLAFLKSLSRSFMDFLTFWFSHGQFLPLTRFSTKGACSLKTVLNWLQKYSKVCAFVEPSTMLTSMVNAEKVTNAAGQKITVFTSDQQLYSVVLDTMWADRDCWMFFVSWLGGMHQLMSSNNSICALMADSGLKEILRSAFAGSDKMLQRKKFPLNLTL